MPEGGREKAFDGSALPRGKGETEPSNGERRSRMARGSVSSLLRVQARGIALFNDGQAAPERQAECSLGAGGADDARSGGDPGDDGGGNRQPPTGNVQGGVIACQLPDRQEEVGGKQHNHRDAQREIRPERP